VGMYSSLSSGRQVNLRMKRFFFGGPPLRIMLGMSHFQVPIKKSIEKSEQA
jgi:hypothetical protein